MKWKLIILLFFFGCGNSSVEKPVENKTQSTVPEKKENSSTFQPKKEIAKEEPEQVNLSANHDATIPQELDYSNLIPPEFCQTKSLCIKNKFYPIGWSKEGHFAFINERPPVNVGTIFTFVVIDMITDKKVALIRWVEEFETLSELWSDKKTEISQVLNQYEIHPFLKSPQLLPFPAKINGEKYSASISEVHDDNGYLSRQKLIIKSKSLGKKKVYDYQRKKDTGPFGTTTSKAIGAYQSPYEDRMVILKLNDIYAFEGDRELDIEFIGCYLKK